MAEFQVTGSDPVFSGGEGLMRFFRSRRQQASSDARQRRLSMEPLEERRLLSANLALIDAYLVDGQNNEITSPILGERIGVRAVFETTDLPAGAQYTLDYTIDGVTLSNSRLTVGAGEAFASYSVAKTGWHATAGTHTLVVQIDAGDLVAESNEADNTLSFNFVPTTANPPAQLIWPLEGAPFTELYISNYVDVDPTGGILDYTGNDASYDGHTAWDIGAGNFHEMDLGVKLYAAADGTVSHVHDGEFDRYTSWGSPSPTANYVKIDHGDGWQTIYWHLRRDSLQVEVGQEVEAGDFIGHMGSSGKSSGAHLHFGLRHHGRVVEPAIDADTYFVDPLRYVGDAPTVYLSGITNYSPSAHSKERPSDVEVFPQTSGQTTYVWARFAGLREDDLVQYVWKKPDDTVHVIAALTSSQDYSNAHWWFSRNLPTVPELGTWKVEFHVNGTKLGEDSFQVTANGAPEILVEEAGAIVLDERYTPLDFGSVSKNAASPTRVFTVTNHGDQLLTLGAPILPAGFLLSEALAASLEPGQSDTFTVRLATDTAGYFAGQVRFTSNDADESDYNFSVEGLVDATLSSELVLGISERQANEGDSVFANVRRLGSTASALTVTLASADTSEISLPASVTIPAGEERAMFLVQAVADYQPDGDQVTSISASATGHATARNTLRVIHQQTTPAQIVSVTRDDGNPTDGTLETLAFTFDQPVNVDVGALSLSSASAGGAPLDMTGVAFSYDAATLTAGWDFSGAAAIDAGFYTVLVAAALVTDDSGTPLDGNADGIPGDDFSVDLLVARRGDSDTDGDVDLSDYNTLATHFDPIGTGGPYLWSDGNFDADNDIDLSDYNDLASHFDPLGYDTSSPATLADAALEPGEPFPGEPERPWRVQLGSRQRLPNPPLSNGPHGPRPTLTAAQIASYEAAFAQYEQDRQPSGTAAGARWLGISLAEQLRQRETGRVRELFAR